MIKLTLSATNKPIWIAPHSIICLEESKDCPKGTLITCVDEWDIGVKESPDEVVERLGYVEGVHQIIGTNLLPYKPAEPWRSPPFDPTNG